MKVGVPSYFIIIIIIYSFKCSALTCYSPAARYCCRTEVGAVEGVCGWGVGSTEKRDLLRGGRGWGALTRSILLYWPAGGALMLSLDKRAKSLRAARQACSFTQLQKAGEL